LDFLLLGLYIFTQKKKISKNEDDEDMDFDLDLDYLEPSSDIMNQIKGSSDGGFDG